MSQVVVHRTLIEILRIGWARSRLNKFLTYMWTPNKRRIGHLALLQNGQLNTKPSSTLRGLSPKSSTHLLTAIRRWKGLTPDGQRSGAVTTVSRHARFAYRPVIQDHIACMWPDTNIFRNNR